MKPAIMKKSTIRLPLNANLEKGKDNKFGTKSHVTIYIFKDR